MYVNECMGNMLDVSISAIGSRNWQGPWGIGKDVVCTTKGSNPMERAQSAGNDGLWVLVRKTLQK